MEAGLESVAENLLPKNDEGPNMFSKSWLPLMYMALFMFMTAAAQMVFIPNVACAALNGGIDPCLPGSSDPDTCAHVLQAVSTAQATSSSAGSILVIFASPICGAVSDVIGRKPVLILLMCLFSASWPLLAAVKAGYVSVYSFYVFGVFSFPAGTLLNMIFTTMIADRLPTEHLEVSLGAFYGMSGIGPVAATLFIAVFSDVTCLMLFLVMSIFACVIALADPETLPEKQRKALSDMQSVKHTLRDAVTLALDPRFFRISCLIFFAYIQPAGIATVFALAFKAIYGIGMQATSLAVLIGGLSTASMNLFFMKPIRDRGGNKGVIIVASLASVASLIAKGWSPSLTVLLVATILDGAYAMFPPTVNAILFKLAPPHLHGQAQGMGFSLLSVSCVVGPIVYGEVFVFFEQPHFGFTGTFPQSPFALGAAAWCIVSVVVASMPNAAVGDAE